MYTQELQADLHSVMHLEKRRAEYQLAVYLGAGSQYVKHRDALPDDGADPNQRRVGSSSACNAPVHPVGTKFQSLLLLPQEKVMQISYCCSWRACQDALQKAAAVKCCANAL